MSLNTPGNRLQHRSYAWTATLALALLLPLYPSLLLPFYSICLTLAYYCGFTLLLSYCSSYCSTLSASLWPLYADLHRPSHKQSRLPKFSLEFACKLFYYEPYLSTSPVPESGESSVSHQSDRKFSTRSQYFPASRFEL